MKLKSQLLVTRRGHVKFNSQMICCLPSQVMTMKMKIVTMVLATLVIFYRGCEEQIDEVQSEDQMTYEVAEDAAEENEANIQANAEAEAAADKSEEAETSNR